MNPEAYLEMAKTESQHWWFRGRRAILSNIIDGLNLPQNPGILEIGCGTGGNLDMLSRFGEVRALEADAGAREIAANKTGGLFDIRAGHCPDDIPFQNQRFDLICMFDVLEHIERDVDTLVAAKSLLVKNGFVLLTVPAYQWLWGKHDEFLHHKRRYSAQELRLKIDKAGFRPLKLSYFNTFLFPLVAMVRLKERVFHGSKVSGGNIPPARLNSMLRNIFSAEKYILAKAGFPFGVSLLAILQEK